MKTVISCLVLTAMLFTLGTAQARTISFSGYEWTVKTTGEGQWGPGPNYFSDSEENVWVDGDGKLHLKITERDGKWYCAEVLSEETLGYGMYRFYVEGRIDLLDENVVLGLFTWDDDPAYAHREIDFEASKWADPDNENAQFVVQPWEPDENMHRFDIQLNGTHSTHSFDWKPDRIFFQSVHGHYADPPATHIIESWRYDGPDLPPTGNEKVHINLWLFQGEPPSDGQEIELVISEFEFVPTPDVEAMKSFDAFDHITETPITDVFVGNTITYFIDVTNFLDQTISLLVHDELSSLTTYTDGSFRVNDSLVDDEDFADGILDYEFSGLEQYETLTLAFDVTVNDDALHSAMIENMAFVTAYTLSGVVLTDVETNLTQIRVENPETVIPEPSTFISLIIGGCGLLWLRRYKRSL